MILILICECAENRAISQITKVRHVVPHRYIYISVPFYTKNKISHIEAQPFNAYNRKESSEDLVHFSPSDKETQHNPKYYERLLYLSGNLLKNSNYCIISSMLRKQTGRYCFFRNILATSK